MDHNSLRAWDSKQDLLIASGPNYGPSQTAGGVSDRPKVDRKWPTAIVAE